MKVAISTPVDQLRHDLQTRFPTARIAVRKADDPRGVQTLNLLSEGVEVAVEWKPDEGFGISSFCDGCHALAGMFEASDEWYSRPEAAFHRIVSLALERQNTRPAAMTIPEMRHARGVSQQELAATLQVQQATYSKMERREDVKVSSLKRVIEAMGGKLLIQAVFPDTREVREITFR